MRMPYSRFAAAAVTLIVLLSRAEAPAASWLDVDWGQRVELRAKPELVAGSLSDFTFLVRIEADSLGIVFDQALADGSDLLFTAGDGTTVLEHELVSYDPVEGEAEIWVRAPSLSPTENVFYMYFGNTLLTGPVVSGDAWSDDHVGVYHFDADPVAGVQPDSGPRGNDAFVGFGTVWDASDAVPGQIGQGWRLDAVDNYLYTPSVSTTDSSFTISAWFWNAPEVNKGMVALATADPSWDLSFQRSGNDPHGGYASTVSEIFWWPTIAAGTMRHYAWVLDAEADSVRFFLDGEEQAIRIRYVAPTVPNRVFTRASLQGRVSIAGPLYGAAPDLAGGIVDEFRIVEGVRGPEWIATEYANQSDAVAFFEYDVQTAPSVTSAEGTLWSGRGLGPVTVWPNPFRGVADISVRAAGAEPRVRVYDAAGRLVRELLPLERGGDLVRLRWDGRDDQGRSVGNGLYYVRAVESEHVSSAKVILVR